MYPTLLEVEAADRMQICKWYRHLPSPGSRAIGQVDFESVLEAEGEIMDRIVLRFKQFGGFTPEISKAIGW